MSDSPEASLRAENAELKRRVELAEAAISRLTEESLARESAARQLVADLPRAVSRKSVLADVVRDSLKQVRTRLRRRPSSL
jgi:hypothetical protein